jgi:hypothetical protein
MPPTRREIIALFILDHSGRVMIMAAIARFLAHCSKSPYDKVGILLFQVNFAKALDHFANRNRFITLRTVNRVIQSTTLR